MDLWVVTPCSLENSQGLGGTHRLHLQGRTVIQAENRQASSPARFHVSPNYTALQGRDGAIQICYSFVKPETVFLN
jgi:hypothetical protein